MLLVAGDLFDSPDPDPTDLEAVIKEFGRLSEAGKRIFAIPGNHDYAKPNSFWRRLDIPSLHVFVEPEWETIVLEDLGVAVRGIAFDRANTQRRAFDGLDTVADMPTVVLMHASYEAFEGQVDRYHPFNADELGRLGASYVALGHYHRFSPIRAGRTTACYPGTPEGIAFDGPETEDRFAVLGEIGEDGGLSFETVKTNTRVMRRLELDCTSFESQIGLYDAVRRACESNVLLEVRLTGVPSSDLAKILEALPERFKDSCLYMAVDTSHLQPASDLPVDDRTIRGRFCRYLLDQINSATDEERKRLFRRALELGLAAFAEE